MRRLRGLAAAWAVASLLACSGIGACWKWFVPSGHACCEQQDAAAPAPACAAVAAHVTPALLAPPCAAIVRAPSELPAPALSTHASPFANLFAKAPPLVLRI